MQCAVLAAPQSWYYRDLRRAAGDEFRLSCVDFGSLQAALDGDELRLVGRLTESDELCDLLAVEAVLVRTMPPGSLEQVVFRMDLLGQAEARGRLVLNPPRAVEAAVDKYLTSARLQAAGLCTPRTIACQSAEAALAAFETLGRDVVLKPLFGAEGRGLARLQDDALVLRAARMLEQLGAVLYLQEFIPHEGCDLRLFVLGEQVYGMRRCNPADWRTNISRGARGEPLIVTSELEALARRAAAAVGAPLAGVDILPGVDGRLYVLEVNAVPGWKALARTLQRDIAREVLLYVRDRLAGRAAAAGRDPQITQISQRGG